MQASIITLDEDTLKAEMREVVRSTVEEVINGILDAQADELASAGRYERTDKRQAYRSGHYTRGLLTQAGRIEVSVPKLRGARFTTEVIERYRRRESSVEEAMMETCFLGVSTRNVEEVTNILWEEGVSAGTVSNLNQDAYRKVDEWRTRPLTCEYPYVFVDGTYVKRSWGDAYESVAVLVAIGVKKGNRTALPSLLPRGRSGCAQAAQPRVPVDRDERRMIACFAIEGPSLVSLRIGRSRLAWHPSACQPTPASTDHGAF